MQPAASSYRDKERCQGVEEGGEVGRNFSNGDECEYVFNGFFHLMFVMHDL